MATTDELHGKAITALHKKYSKRQVFTFPPTRPGKLLEKGTPGVLRGDKVPPHCFPLGGSPDTSGLHFPAFNNVFVLGL